MIPPLRGIQPNSVIIIPVSITRVHRPPMHAYHTHRHILRPEAAARARGDGDDLDGDIAAPPLPKVYLPELRQAEAAAEAAAG